MAPKILVFDIETSPILGFVWNLWDQNIGLNQIHTDWHLLSWAAKWLTGKEMFYMDQSQSRDIENDKPILQGIWKLLDEAEIVITQNGKKFDVKKLNARFIQQGMKPPSSYRHIDVCQEAKKHFGFTSNKLEYLASKLCKKYKKQKHKKFEGFELWKECLLGNQEAWKVMQHYNKHDVWTLEELYHVIQPWINTLNFEFYTDDLEAKCNCGSRDIVKDGFRWKNSCKYQRYRCRECGAGMHGGKDLLLKDKKRGILKR